MELVSPLGLVIAIIESNGPRLRPTVRPHERGLDPYKLEFTNETEFVKGLVNQHLELHGGVAEDAILLPGEARVVVKRTVTNFVQINHNSLGVQTSGEELKLQINEAVDNASPSTLKKVLKEWIPQAVVGGSISSLLAMLGL